MPEPAEATRLLGGPQPLSNTHHELESGWGKPISDPYAPKPHVGPVNVNTMKRNMSIAKGFMDISLLTANANQLKHLLLYGDKSDNVYTIIFTGLVLSLIFQIATGVILIMKERFDINLECDQKSADIYNNITVALVFITLLLNVFISSFGVSVVMHEKDYDPVYQDNKGRKLEPSLAGGGDTIHKLTTQNSLAEMI